MLVLGAGAIGGYFGGRLAHAGADVTFLVRPKRIEQLERDGICIRSPVGDLRHPARAVLASQVLPGYDFVLLTCKAYDLESAMDAIAPAVDDRCTIVPLLNGLAHVPRLDQRFGPARVMGGTCSISAIVDPNGTILHADPLQRISFGERDRSNSARARMLADAFSATAVEWELSDDIEQAMWEKIALLSVLAAASCLFRANMGEIVGAGGLAMIEQAVAVNFEIAKREGHPPRTIAREFARQNLTTSKSKRSGSMLHDIEAGRAVESDHIVGWMLEKARSHGLDAPLLALAYTHLKAYEARKAAGRLPAS